MDTKLREKYDGQTKKNCMYPDMYHSVMVASKLLETMYKEREIVTLLQTINEKSQSDILTGYKFQTFDETLKHARAWESTPPTLPLGTLSGGGIPVDQLRRVVSTKVAAIASFFAFACYDSPGIQKAYSLLQKNVLFGDQITNKQILDEGSIVLQDANTFIQKDYLLKQNRMDEGHNFVRNVINVVNHLGECMKAHAKFRPEPRQNAKTKAARKYQYLRLESHLYRTLCSDMVEIYVTHGCYPGASPSLEDRHPDLYAWANDEEKKMFLVLFLF
jgi:hypothetical protein